MVLSISVQNVGSLVNSTFWYPSVWYCKRLRTIQRASEDAVPVAGLGFMCDCMKVRRPIVHRDGKLDFIPCKQVVWVRDPDFDHNVIHKRHYPTIFIRKIGFLNSKREGP